MLFWDVAVCGLSHMRETNAQHVANFWWCITLTETKMLVVSVLSFRTKFKATSIQRCFFLPRKCISITRKVDTSQILKQVAVHFAHVTPANEPVPG